MGSELVKIGHIKKPVEGKHETSLSRTELDEPLKHGANAQIEAYSDMRRTRIGVQEGAGVYSDRTFGMEQHPNGKPLDTGH